MARNLTSTPLASRRRDANMASFGEEHGPSNEAKALHWQLRNFGGTLERELINKIVTPGSNRAAIDTVYRALNELGLMGQSWRVVHEPAKHCDRCHQSYLEIENDPSLCQIHHDYRYVSIEEYKREWEKYRNEENALGLGPGYHRPERVLEDMKRQAKADDVPVMACSICHDAFLPNPPIYMIGRHTQFFDVTYQEEKKHRDHARKCCLNCPLPALRRGQRPPPVMGELYDEELEPTQTD